MVNESYLARRSGSPSLYPAEYRLAMGDPFDVIPFDVRAHLTLTFAFISLSLGYQRRLVKVGFRLLRECIQGCGKQLISFAI